MRDRMPDAIALAVRLLEPSVVCGASVAETARLTTAWAGLARQGGSVVLGAVELAGDVLGIGRYHRRPEDVAMGVGVYRRRGGGRPVPLGDGFALLVLALPHRAALVGEAPEALGPEQVLNRAVRGVLGACEALGISAHYPGRDVVTVQRRTLAGLTFDVEADGTTVVEIALALRRNYAEVSRIADGADPHGVVPLAFVGPECGTSIAESTGRPVVLEELATLVARALRARFVLALGDAPAGDEAPMDAVVAADPRDVHEPGLRRASRASMLGTIEAYVAADAGRIRAVRLCGDLIAPAWVIAAVEQALVGLPADPDVVGPRIERELEAGSAFVLGAAPADLAALVVEAVRE